ncbi:hypothetical protein LTR28_004103 [Elasticomyces elasticus]|nr:hypothetical protein LTR28_004103 [Elasticomyces elasticus]
MSMQSQASAFRLSKTERAGEEVQIFGKKRLSDLAEAGGLFAALGGLHHGYGDESASGYRRDRVGPVDIDVDVNVEAIGSGEL